MIKQNKTYSFASYKPGKPGSLIKRNDLLNSISKFMIGVVHDAIAMSLSDFLARRIDELFDQLYPKNDEEEEEKKDAE